MGPYIIGVGDVIILATQSGADTVEHLSSLLAAQNRCQSYTVQDDGAIAVPDMGRIELAGLTIDAAKAAVFERLVEARIMPSFSLKIANFNSKPFRPPGSAKPAPGPRGQHLCRRGLRYRAAHQFRGARRPGRRRPRLRLSDRRSDLAPRASPCPSAGRPVWPTRSTGTRLSTSRRAIRAICTLLRGADPFGGVPAGCSERRESDLGDPDGAAAQRRDLSGRTADHPLEPFGQPDLSEALRTLDVLMQATIPKDPATTDWPFGSVRTA